jgi:signal transduction histidine kinase
VAGRLARDEALDRGLLLAVDGLAAIAICVAAVVSLPNRHDAPSMVLGAVAAAVASLTVLGRRLAPFAATIVAIVATVVCQRLTHQPLLDVQPFAIILDTYSAAVVALERRRWRRLAALLAFSVGAVIVLASTASTFGVSLVVKAVVPVVVAPAVGAGLVAWRRQLSRRLELTRGLLEDEQEMRVARAAVEERNRVARELHDVVAHAMTVMVIQAGAARIMVADDPTAAAERLRKVGEAGRVALADLRRLVGPMRRNDTQSDVHPAGFARLAELTRSVSDVGILTDLVVDTGDEQVSDALQHVIYRVVQEALTNAVKHVGCGTATVTVQSTPDAVEVHVVNCWAQGRPGRQSWTSGGGRGLSGMAERLRQHGGVLRTGATADVNFEVWARVPLRIGVSPTRGAPIWRRWWVFGAWQRVARWSHAWVAVAALVALELDVAFSSERRGSLLLNVVVVGTMAIATLGRRSHPLSVCVAITFLAIPLSGGLADITQATIVSTFVFVVPVYSVAAWAELQSAVVGLVAIVAMTWSIGVWHAVAGSVIIINCALTFGLWIVGRLVRAQRRLATDLARATAELLAQQAIRQRAMAQLERARIVRDLQASVLRDVTAMVVMADSLLDEHPDGADAVTVDRIGAIEASGRVALAHMRDVLGELRVERGGSAQAAAVSA